MNEYEQAPIVNQCDCIHDVEGRGQTERCENRAEPGDGGLCKPCLFGCAP